MDFKAPLNHGIIDYLTGSKIVNSFAKFLITKHFSRVYTFGPLLQFASLGFFAPSTYANTLTARDREFYWYGVSAGIAITVYELELNGDVRKDYARPFIRDALSSNCKRGEPKMVERLIDASKSKNCKGVELKYFKTNNI